MALPVAHYDMVVMRQWSHSPPMGCFQGNCLGRRRGRGLHGADDLIRLMTPYEFTEAMDAVGWSQRHLAKKAGSYRTPGIFANTVRTPGIFANTVASILSGLIIGMRPVQLLGT
jgi:hypothetical protein